MRYEEELDKLINDNKRFVRCFYGECPECGEHIFSVDDTAEDGKIKAKFICTCGKKFKQTVYSAKMNKYRYPQALVEVVQNTKYGDIRALKLKGKYFFIHNGKVVSRSFKEV